MVGVVGSSPIVPTRIPQPDQIFMSIRLFVGMNSGMSFPFVLHHARHIRAFIRLSRCSATSNRLYSQRLAMPSHLAGGRAPAYGERQRKDLFCYRKLAE